MEVLQLFQAFKEFQKIFLDGSENLELTEVNDKVLLQLKFKVMQILPKF